MMVRTVLDILVDFAFFSASGKPRGIVLKSFLLKNLLIVGFHQLP